jgi:hypothetical protein
MSELEDFIAESAGVQLHRKRVITAFSHVGQGPLLNVLFNQTRPPLLRKAKPVRAAQPKSSAPTILRRGMVDYRREFRHEDGTPLP